MTVAHQAPLSLGFPRQEYWSGLPFLTPGDLPEPGIDPESLASPALAGRIFITAPSAKPSEVYSSVQSLSRAQLCPTLCDLMDCSMPGFPVHQQLLKLDQTHVHQVGDAIQLSHPLSSASPPAFKLSQHQSLFQ